MKGLRRSLAPAMVIAGTVVSASIFGCQTGSALRSGAAGDAGPAGGAAGRDNGSGGANSGGGAGTGAGGDNDASGGAGGLSGAGGDSGVGGGANCSTGSAGATGASPIIGTPLATFDSNTQGFAFDTYHDTFYTNLADGIDPANLPPTLTFDVSQGSPAPGSLRVAAPFSGANQYVDITHVLGLTMLANWSGRTLHVRIKVSEGTFKGGAELYVKTGATYTFAGTYVLLAPGACWQELTLKVDAPMTRNPGYDASQVIVYGIQLNTGSAGVGSTPVTFNIDSFSID